MGQLCPKVSGTSITLTLAFTELFLPAHRYQDLGGCISPNWF
jgi:hypothetical protein